MLAQPVALMYVPLSSPQGVLKQPRLSLRNGHFFPPLPRDKIVRDLSVLPTPHVCEQGDQFVHGETLQSFIPVE